MALALLFLLSGGLLYSALQNKRLREQQAQQLTTSFVIARPGKPKEVRKSPLVVPVISFMIALAVYAFFFAPKTVRVDNEFGRNGIKTGRVSDQPDRSIDPAVKLKKKMPVDDLAGFEYQ